jgi:hypothetical protein
MPKGILLVSTAPAGAERDQEYNDWYNDVHLPEVLKVSGFISARRFKKVESADDPVPYLAIYEVEADDLSASVAALGAGVASGEIQMTDAMDAGKASLTLFEQIAERSS